MGSLDQTWLSPPQRGRERSAQAQRRKGASITTKMQQRVRTTPPSQRGAGGKRLHQQGEREKHHQQWDRSSPPPPPSLPPSLPPPKKKRKEKKEEEGTTSKDKGGRRAAGATTPKMERWETEAQRRRGGQPTTQCRNGEGTTTPMKKRLGRSFGVAGLGAPSASRVSPPHQKCNTTHHLTKMTFLCSANLLSLGLTSTKCSPAKIGELTVRLQPETELELLAVSLSWSWRGVPQLLWRGRSGLTNSLFLCLEEYTLSIQLVMYRFGCEHSVFFQWHRPDGEQVIKRRDEVAPNEWSPSCCLCWPREVPTSPRP